jgi:hypothetical protein
LVAARSRRTGTRRQYSSVRTRRRLDDLPDYRGGEGGELLATRSASAAAYLSALYSPFALCSSAYLETRIWDKNRAPVQRWFALTPESLQVAATHCVDQSATRDVYVGVLPRIYGRGDSSALRACGCLWCDIDGGEEGVTGAMDRLKSAVHRLSLPYPNLLVISGSGLHAYWFLLSLALCRTKEEQDRIRKILRRLVVAIGGESPNAHADIASAEPARVLRVPGTRNHKRENNPRPVRLLRCVTGTGGREAARVVGGEPARRTAPAAKRTERNVADYSGPCRSLPGLGTR